MGKKNSYDYFEALVDLVKISGKACKFMAGTIDSFQDGITKEQIEEAHAIEHAGDEKKHEMMNRLLTEFITPVEREDIVGITQRIDDVTDAVEDVTLKMYMFRVTTLREECHEFAELIIRCCEALKTMMKEFHHFKKPAKLGQLMIEVHNLESEGDDLYERAVRKLFEDEKDNAVDLFVWTEIFRRMEMCLDAMEEVTEVAEMVIMKNS